MMAEASGAKAKNSARLIAFAATQLKGRTFDDAHDEARKAVAIPLRVIDDSIQRYTIIILHSSPQCECEHPVRQGSEKFLALLVNENFFEVGRICKRFSGKKFAASVHFEFAIFFAPGADAIEVFKAETNGVHARMAGGADPIFAMLFHALAETAFKFTCLLFQLRDVRRRWWGRRPKDVFENPFAAFYGRGAGGIGSDGEDAALCKETTTLPLFEGDFLKIFSGDAIDAVVLREAFVHETEIRVEEFKDAAVLLHDVGDEEFGFSAHGVAQLGVPGGESFFVGSDVVEIADLQPLIGEVIHERARLGILEHARDLSFEVFSESLFLGEFAEACIWHRAPEEIGEAGGEGEFVDGMNSFGIVGLGLQFAAKKEMRRN
jgi:hypothetical protein